MAAPTPSGRALSTVPVRAQEKGVFCDIGTITYAATANPNVEPVIKVAAGTTVVDCFVILPASLGALTQVSLGDGATMTGT